MRSAARVCVRGMFERTRVAATYTVPSGRSVDAPPHLWEFEGGRRGCDGVGWNESDNNAGLYWFDRIRTNIKAAMPIVCYNNYIKYVCFLFISTTILIIFVYLLCL